MIAYVTSIGEPTTELCIWALERNGYDVVIFRSDNSLWQKLSDIYETAVADFNRVDADVIVHRNLHPERRTGSQKDQHIWCWQLLVFDWYKQDVGHSMAFINKAALPSLRANIDRFKLSLRPETEVSRIPELHNPRRMITYDHQIMGIHGFGINDLSDVKRLKEARNQMDNYDFELVERLNAL